ncbi:hypothetical protein NDU88_005014 [Pleurodeles waltl]|uniref:Uncharacterized protein n=1 Tax=Pleurodeles waltl TaxID=8319 RepID=A0AAV7WBI0_PLEWA|nr:hypothetical protein NDU88_005014 [Pleurodeles waltl]
MFLSNGGLGLLEPSVHYGSATTTYQDCSLVAAWSCGVGQKPRHAYFLPDVAAQRSRAVGAPSVSDQGRGACSAFRYA